MNIFNGQQLKTADLKMNAIPSVASCVFFSQVQLLTEIEKALLGIP